MSVTVPAPVRRPHPSPLASHWPLDPSVVFLNHGSYGACPTPVLEAQRALRDRMERELVRFFMVDLERQLDTVRERAASFLGCNPRDLALTQNATLATASAIHSLGLGPGDEVLVSDHEYSSTLNELARGARRHGYTVVNAGIPFPVSSPDELADALLAGVTPRTRAAVVSHITSSTALIFPIERIVNELRSRGVVTVIDSAHSPGQVACDIESLGADYCAGLFHKWCCSPKGAGFLWARPELQERTEPVALSSRAHIHRDDRSRFNCLYDYVGTDDPTAALSVPAALDFIASLHPEGWAGVRAHNHDLAVRGRRAVCERLGVEPPCPDDMCGSMGTIVLPGVGLDSGGIRPGGYEDPLQQRLVEKWGIQVPVWSLPSRRQRLLRVSAQLYNTIEQYEYLAEALAQELRAD